MVQKRKHICLKKAKFIGTNKKTALAIIRSLKETNKYSSISSPVKIKTGYAVYACKKSNPSIPSDIPSSRQMQQFLKKKGIET